MAEDANRQDKGPLAGVRVLDFTRVLSGPFATMMLGDLGAEVIKIESVEKGDDTRGFPPFVGPLSHYYIALNRNKRSLALDLKSPEGLEIARALAAKSDILVENFRPGVMERLGLGAEALQAANPNLIYCSISGFGAGSPLSDKPAFDVVAQALSGVMSINREPGGAPNKLGIPMGDMGAGIYAVFAILAALAERRAGGKARRIDIAMLDSLLGLLGYLAQIYFVTGQSPQPVGTKHPSIVPYGAYPTADGHIIVACLTEAFWRNLARAISREDLLEDLRFKAYADRLANRVALEEIIAAATRAQPTAWWQARLEDCDVPNAPILSVAEALEQPHTVARGMTRQVAHPATGELRLVDNPIRFPGEGTLPLAAPQLLGEASAAVLKEVLGYDAERMAALLEAGVIRAPGGDG